MDYHKSVKRSVKFPHVLQRRDGLHSIRNTYRFNQLCIRRNVNFCDLSSEEDSQVSPSSAYVPQETVAETKDVTGVSQERETVLQPSSLSQLCKETAKETKEDAAVPQKSATVLHPSLINGRKMTAREEMLAKWKKEKMLKKEEERKNKKKPFCVGICRTSSSIGKPISAAQASTAVKKVNPPLPKKSTAGRIESAAAGNKALKKVNPVPKKPDSVEIPEAITENKQALKKGTSVVKKPSSVGISSTSTGNKAPKKGNPVMKKPAAVRIPNTTAGNKALMKENLVLKKPVSVGVPNKTAGNKALIKRKPDLKKPASVGIPNTTTGNKLSKAVENVTALKKVKPLSLMKPASGRISSTTAGSKALLKSSENARKKNAIKKPTAAEKTGDSNGKTCGTAVLSKQKHKDAQDTLFSSNISAIKHFSVSFAPDNYQFEPSMVPKFFKEDLLDHSQQTGQRLKERSAISKFHLEPLFSDVNEVSPEIKLNDDDHENTEAIDIIGGKLSYHKTDCMLKHLSVIKSSEDNDTLFSPANLTRPFLTSTPWPSRCALQSLQAENRSPAPHPSKWTAAKSPKCRYLDIFSPCGKENSETTAHFKKLTLSNSDTSEGGAWHGSTAKTDLTAVFEKLRLNSDKCSDPINFLTDMHSPVPSKVIKNM